MESYLAWAMVEFGVDLVCTGWNGYVANLHSGGDPAQQVRRIVPERSMLGRRIRNRHRLLAVVGGAWLPPPLMKALSPSPPTGDWGSAKCPGCDFARSLDEGGLPSACAFYCQMERGWDCRSAGRECALLGCCDQHDKFVAYERVDLFNRLRQSLLDEEEERLAFAAVVPTLSEGAGFVAEGFRVLEASTNTLRLRIPSGLQSLVFASPGDVLTAVRDGQSVAELRLVRRKDAELRLEPRRGRLPTFHPSEDLSLRFAPESG